MIINTDDYHCLMIPFFGVEVLEHIRRLDICYRAYLVTAESNRRILLDARCAWELNFNLV